MPAASKGVAFFCKELPVLVGDLYFASQLIALLFYLSSAVQARERELRTVEVNRHLSQLKELQALLKARADKEAEINSLRTSIERWACSCCVRLYVWVLFVVDVFSV